VFTFLSSFGFFDLRDGESASGSVPPGDYLFGEIIPSGWIVSSIDCGAASTTPLANGVTVHLAPGEDVTCTFNNQASATPSPAP
jgi:hypothetical protein